MTNKLSVASRILVAFASGALIAVFFLPAWRIDLFAPQYPEGLTMNIWINKLTGDTEIINGLNHYIGMKQISESMFPEFRILPYVVGFFMLFGLLVAITGRRKLLFLYIIFTVIGGFLAMYDFYQWGYDYGHHLDPNAPIQVPGLSYQPPLFGHKRLLNFDAYSFPHIGGWIVIGAAFLAFGVWFFERIRSKPLRAGISTTKVVPLVLITFVLINACSTEPRPIQLGKENCSHCKMTIMDIKYSGEIISKKGKVYQFDDAICVSKFIQDKTVRADDIKSILITDFNNNNQFVPVDEVWLVRSASILSPMNGQTIGFAKKTDAEAYISSLPEGKLLTWNEFQSMAHSKNQPHVH